MAEVRPLRALRYAPHLDMALLISPPYDVISPQQRERLAQRSLHNIVRLELPQADDGDRYQEAAKLFYEWQSNGVLLQDGRPLYYVYRQTFTHAGQTYQRLSIFAAVQLEPWESGVIRPHERTLGPPKEDRLRLLRALGTNTSPVFGLYRDSAGQIAEILEAAVSKAPLLDFDDPDGQHHTLWRIDQRPQIEALHERFAGETIYIADGHHRYETALTYLEEAKQLVHGWSSEDPENFVLMGLTAGSDPGLVLLPIHRLVQSAVSLEQAFEKLTGVFEIEPVNSLERMQSLLKDRGKLLPAIGMVAAESPDLYVLTCYGPADLEPLLPPESPPQLRNLDTAVLQYAVLAHALGISEDEIAAGEVVQYTEDAEEAVEAVRSGVYNYAFVMNPVRPAQVMDVADTGQRLPQKSTFFYPKLPTGLVLNPVASP